MNDFGRLLKNSCPLRLLSVKGSFPQPLKGPWKETTGIICSCFIQNRSLTHWIRGWQQPSSTPENSTWREFWILVLPRAVGRQDWPGEAAQAGDEPLKSDGYIFETKPSLHYWHTPDNAQNSLVRGTAEDQQLAVRDLYALLLHTSSTHAPAEFGTYPWSTRDLLGSSIHDILPDGPPLEKPLNCSGTCWFVNSKTSFICFPPSLQSGSGREKDCRWSMSRRCLGRSVWIHKSIRMLLSGHGRSN